MAAKATQRHTRASTPVAHHCVSPEDDTASQKKQSQWVILILANLLCLVVAGMYVWATRDLVGFLILYGIATEAINVRDAIGAAFPRRLPNSVQKEKED